MTYRKDIDGLRALAVIAVILSHLGFSFFSGGFIGVDIFFVISGYLITQTIQQDIQDKKFTISHFYIKRIRRIIPALFVVVTTTTLVSLFILPIYELKEFALSIVSVATFTSNIFFWFNSDYFSVASEIKPLLHTWSLGIEEQFYIVFPVFMLLTQKLIRKKVIYWILFFFMISFLLSVSSFGTNNPTTNFFLPMTRFWELLAGTILALSIKYIDYTNNFFNTILSFIGLILILFPMVLLDKYSTFPGINAFYPVLGAVLILYTGRKTTYLALALSIPPIRYIGLISYSLYLWHWPIIALTNNFIIGEFTIITQISILLLSLFLAIITYHYVEQPFRKNSKLKNFLQLRMGFFSLVILAIVASSIILFVNNTYEKKIIADIQDPSTISTRCFSEPETLESTKRCSFGDIESDKIFLLYGDSHVAAMSPAFNKLAKEKHWRGIRVGIAGCAPLFNVFRLDGIGNGKDCTGLYAKNVERFLEENKDNIDKVFLVSRWTLFEKGWIKNGRLQKATHFLSDDKIKSKNASDSAKVLEKGLIRTVDKLSRRLNIQTTIFAPVPVLHGDIKNSNTINVTKKEYITQRYFVDNIFKTFKDNDLVNIIDPINIFCPEDICLMHKDKKALYTDDNHVSKKGALLLYPLLESELPRNKF